MLNKDLIKKKFEKNIKTYDKNAVVQNKMADYLIEQLPCKKYSKILEIGSYTGILTKKTINNIEFNDYLAIDIVDSFDYIKNLSDKIRFKQVSIEEFENCEKFDLIIANASLQWCKNFNQIAQKLKNMLNPKGTIAIGIFGKNNLIEIKDAFSVSLDYITYSELAEIFPDFNIEDENIILNFNNPIEILRHLKETGVNSLKENLNYKEIKKGLKILEDKHLNKITYNPIYVVNKSI